MKKGAIKQVPRRGGVMLRCHLLLVGSYIAGFECCRRARCQRLSFLMFLPLCQFFSLLFVMLIASCFPISWGGAVATAAPLFLARRCSQWPYKITHYLWILFSFSLFFEWKRVGRGISWFVNESECGRLLLEESDSARANNLLVSSRYLELYRFVYDEVVVALCWLYSHSYILTFLR